MKKWRRWLAGCLAVVLLLSGIGCESGFASYMTETVMASTVDEPMQASGKISGFAKFDLMAHSLRVSYENRPLEEELISCMPGTLEVYLEGEAAPCSIPVSWYCLGDEYETTEDYYVQFSPVWDETLYPLAEGMQVEKDAPFIAVFFEDEDSSLFESDHDGYCIPGDNDPVDDCANMHVCYNWLRNNTSLNRAVICGILSNLQTESNFRPDLQDGVAYGMIQWTRGSDRYNDLLTYCKGKGLDYRSISGQLAYMMHEIIDKKEANVKDYPDFYGTIKSVDNCELGSVYSAYLFAHCYERCYINYYLKRQNLARLYWKYFTTSAYVTQGKLKATGVSFPSTIGTDDFYRFSGKLSAAYPITKIKAGFAVYEDYSTTHNALTRAERIALGEVRSAEWLTSPAPITVTPNTTTYDLAKITKTLKASALTVGKTYTFYMAAYVKGTGWTALEQRFVVKKGHIYTPVTGPGLVAPPDPGVAAPAPEVIPDAPVMKAAVTGDGVKIDWIGVKNAGNYLIYRKTGSGDYVKLATLASGVRSYTDKSCKSGVLYTYGVAAKSAEWTTKKRTVKLLIMKTLTPVLSNQKDGIGISWSQISNVTGYVIYRKVSGGSYKKLASVSSSLKSYRDTSAASGVKYTYSVVGYYHGSQDYYGLKSGKSILRLATITPEIANTSEGLKISWKKAEGAEYYKLYRAAAGGSLTLLKTFSASDSRAYTDTSVLKKYGSRYDYAVRAISGSDRSYRVKKSYYRLPEVEMTGLINKSPRSVEVDWFASRYASGYQVQYAENSGMTKNKKTLTVSGRSSERKVISNLVQGKSYYVRIRTYKTVSGTKYYSAWSKKGSVIIKK